MYRRSTQHTTSGDDDSRAVCLLIPCATSARASSSNDTSERAISRASPPRTQCTHKETPRGDYHCITGIMLLIDFLMTSASTSKRQTGDATRTISLAPFMRYTFLLLILLVILQLTPSAVLAADILGDPYKILGISKHATVPAIRKAYKRLAKEW